MGRRIWQTPRQPKTEPATQPAKAPPSSQPRKPAPSRRLPGRCYLCGVPIRSGKDYCAEHSWAGRA